jgi:hypothetical protein
MRVLGPFKGYEILRPPSIPTRISNWGIGTTFYLWKGFTMHAVVVKRPSLVKVLRCMPMDSRHFS